MRRFFLSLALALLPLAAQAFDEKAALRESQAAIGRTIGWIGHAIEQYAEDAIIRPRAKYVGEPPLRAAKS